MRDGYNDHLHAKRGLSSEFNCFLIWNLIQAEIAIAFESLHFFKRVSFV